MTIKEKAEKTGLSIDKVVELCEAAGVDAGDIDRELGKGEAMTLGKVVNEYLNAKKGTEETAKAVRFWTQARKHTIQAGSKRIEFVDHVLVLDANRDIGTVALVRSLKSINGRYSIYEVLDVPFEEESDQAVWFSGLLEDLVFTGHNREVAKAGMKAVRAMFEPEELEQMEQNSFDPRRLVMRALRSKSLKLVSNN